VIGFALGWVLEDEGKYDEAERSYREALAIDRRAYGDQHPSVALPLSGLAGLLAAKGDYTAAEAPLVEKAQRTSPCLTSASTWRAKTFS